MKTKLFFLGIALITMNSCIKEVPPGRMDLLEMQLKSNVTSVMTKGVIESTHTGVLNVSFLRRDQITADTWTGFSTPIPATRNSDGTISFSTKQYYLTNLSNNQSKLVGWYPGSTVSSGKTTININGSTDIMLTEEMVGSKTNAFGKDATMTHTFSHLLTQIRVSAYSRSALESQMWGTITSIEVKQTSSLCKITFPAEVAYDTPVNLDMVTTSRTDDSPNAVNYSINLSLDGNAPSDCGYALIAPAPSTGIVLLVTTQKGGVQEVKVEQQLLKGTAYSIVLLFTAKEIQAKTDIEEWRNSSVNITI